MSACLATPIAAFSLDTSYGVPHTNVSVQPTANQRAYARMVAQRETDEVGRLFQALLRQWRSETRFCSSLSQVVQHPAYEQMIRLGPQVVPLILHELAAQPDHLFYALTAITGENPVHDDDAGDLDAMTRAWLEWGSRQSF